MRLLLRRTAAVTVLAGAALGLLFVVGESTAPAWIPGPPSTTDPYMWRASSHLTPGAFRASVLLTRPGATSKAVQLGWVLDDPATDTTVTEDERIAVGYWPTAAEVVAPDRLLVAGVNKSGNTLIDLWTVQEPLVLYEVPQGGPPGPPVPDRLTPQGLAQIDSLFDAQEAGRSGVVALFRDRSRDHAAFVQFLDSRDLYLLDWTDLNAVTLDLVMTADAPQAGIAYEPRLRSTRYNAYSSGDHKTHRHVYIFSEDVPEASGSDPAAAVPPLVLFDTNQDGALDPNPPVITLEEFHAPPWTFTSADSYHEADGIQNP